MTQITILWCKVLRSLNTIRHIILDFLI